MRLLGSAVLAAMTVALYLVPSAFGVPTVFFVNQTNDETVAQNPEACEQSEAATAKSEKCSLREALEEARGIIATGGDSMEVRLPAGEYHVGKTNGPLPVGTQADACDGGTSACDVEIVGSGPASTIIDGNFETGLIKLAANFPAEEIIEGVTLQHGSAERGGAIQGGSESVVNLDNDVLRHNQASGEGGAVYAPGGETRILNSDLIANTASGSGGAVSANDELLISGSSLTENRAFRGGAVFAQALTFIEGSTIANNIAHEGAAVSGVLATFIEYSTVTRNTVEAPSGAALQGGFRFVLENSIVSANTPSQCSNDEHPESHVANIVFGPSSCSFSGPAPLALDPRLGSGLSSASGEHFPLEYASPAIDAGPAECHRSDQLGVARPLGHACDLGAIEAAADAGVTLRGAPEPVTAGAALTLTATAHAGGSEPLTGVSVKIGVPTGTSFLSGSTGCALSGSVVSCAVGSLAPGESREVQVQVRAERIGGLLETASVSEDQGDYEPANDSATAVGAVAAAIAAPGPPRNTGPASTARAARAGLLGSSIVVDAHGNLLVRVHCAGSSSGGCIATLDVFAAAGTLPALASARRKATLLGRTRVTIAAAKPPLSTYACRRVRGASCPLPIGFTPVC